MLKPITHNCAKLWHMLSTKGGWWSVLRLTRECTPILSLQEVEEHLANLWRHGYVAAEFNQREGSVYAFTAGCIPMPANLIPNEFKPSGLAEPEPRRFDVMHSHYVPIETTYRAGSQDFARCPSLHMGKRFSFTKS